MKRIAPLHLPRMREKGLVVDDLPDEVLVYDLERHKAHCLNITAAQVWRDCDGKTSASEIARRIASQLDAPFNEELVWLALRDLDKLHLLDGSPSLPPRNDSQSQHHRRRGHTARDFDCVADRRRGGHMSGDRLSLQRDYSMLLDVGL
jgi:hypothetical protein